MDHQVMLNKVATKPSLPTVRTTVFRRTRIKLTSRWRSVPQQTSLERIGSSKHLSKSCKWIKSPFTSKLQADAKPNSNFNSRGSKIRLHHIKVQDLLLDDVIEQALPNCYSKRLFLLQRVYGSKTCNDLRPISAKFQDIWAKWLSLVYTINYNIRRYEQKEAKKVYNKNDFDFDENIIRT
ncbi:hypothetical protein ACTFIW_000004 [Dictyostelium discoideum]